MICLIKKHLKKVTFSNIAVTIIVYNHMVDKKGNTLEDLVSAYDIHYQGAARIQGGASGVQRFLTYYFCRFL